MLQVGISIPMDKISEFCRKWKISEFALFGSVLRADFRPESDVDVLINFTEDADWTLYDRIDMADELKDILGREVDLVTKKSLRNPFRRHSILSTKKVLYAA